MILNYLRSAHRNALRNKLQSVIQVLSLAIGLAVFTLVALYYYDESTVERSNPELNRVFRVEMPGLGVDAQDVIPFTLGPELEIGVDEIAHMTRLNYIPEVEAAILGDTESQIRQTNLKGYLTVDEGFFQLFPQDFVWQEESFSFKDAYTIVLTESAAHRLFGKENPLGRTVYLYNAIPNRVIGVIRDPVNTHLIFEGLTPVSTMYSNFLSNGKSIKASVLNHYNFPCYVHLRENADVSEVEQKIGEVWEGMIEEEVWGREELDFYVQLRPLAEVHYADIDPSLGYMSRVDRRDLMNIFLLGLGILLLGMINYVNLSTSMASLRVRELAMRKINGASRKSLILYKLLESVVTTCISFLLALTMVQLMFRPFNRLVHGDINLYFLNSPATWLLCFAGVLGIGILTGLYPALKMSSGSPLAFLYWNSGSKGKGLITRRILMVAQFTFAVVLLMAILTMQRQIKYMHNRDLGFNATQVAHVGTGSMNDKQRLGYRNWMENSFPEVESVCLSQPVPGLNNSDDVQIIDDPESLFYGLKVKVLKADLNFFKVYDLEIIEGGKFLDYFAKEGYSSEIVHKHGDGPFYVINETLQHKLELDNPLGKAIGTGFGPGATIVAVVKDFHFQSLKYPVQAMAIVLNIYGQPWHLSFKINSPDPLKTVEKIEDKIVSTERRKGKLAALPPVRPQINLVQETFANQYEQVEVQRTASIYLSIMSVFIACLGLFGLSIFMAQRRIKEIGIRKAMGATGESIFIFLGKDFLKWVSLSLLIGLPMGYLLSRHWQNQFAYQSGFSIWTFLWTILIVVSVSLLTVIWQSLKASRTNPADALRSE